VATNDPNLLAQRVLALVNDVRARGVQCGAVWHPPAPPLATDALLQRTAVEHTLNMAQRGYFDHVDHFGRGPFERLEHAGYRYAVAGENISAGRATPELVVEWWLQSPDHCSNIMEPRFVDSGVGYASAQDLFGHYWTQTFGVRLP